MKRLLIILIAFIVALLFNELWVKYIIKFPSYGIDKTVHGIRDSEKGVQNIFSSYSYYWDVEGGNVLFQRNNIGLYGLDIRRKKYDKYIYLLGTSFIEAKQINPEKMAASVFFKQISRYDSNYQVINLGCSGHDPYDSYLRIQYFEKYYKPDKVILILNDLYYEWFNRHSYPFNFSSRKNSGEESQGLFYKVQKLSRNTSCSINLLAQYARSLNEEDSKGIDVNNEDNGNNNLTKYNYSNLYRLYDCLKEYQIKYKNDFLCISIISDYNSNQYISRYCAQENINFVYNENINIPANLLKGIGHLNYNGNRKLGELLYGSYVEFYKK